MPKWTGSPRAELCCWVSLSSRSVLRQHVWLRLDIDVGVDGSGMLSLHEKTLFAHSCPSLSMVVLLVLAASCSEGTKWRKQKEGTASQHQTRTTLTWFALLPFHNPAQPWTTTRTSPLEVLAAAAAIGPLEAPHLQDRWKGGKGGNGVLGIFWEVFFLLH